jgi:hypothetical protein
VPVCVLSAVYFDDNALFEADEIKDVISERDLPPKFESAQPPIP